MRIVSVAALVAAASLLGPSVGRAQSLAEVAAKEKEKKKAQKAGKVYTEDDLSKAGKRGTLSVQEGAAPAEASPAAAGAKPEAEAPGAAKEKTDDDKRAEAAKAWRERLQKANDEVARLSKQVDQLQTALNNVSTNLYGSTRTTLIGHLDDAKKQLAAARQSVADLEDEGRRNRY